ncbi:MAG TPA: hypothetical protein DDZ39_02265 [Flavobacteriaceae bacterium]|jgi:hypothetical protein|nr:hypothetical protein [Flavobacteriaceae bacterium]HBS12967.1 hypothetical protein [Flavobacteriaceae bacterium]
MKLLLIIFLITIVLLSAIRLSLLKGKKLQWLAIIIPGLISLGFYNFSLQQNNQTLDWLLQQDNLVSAIAIALTFEAIFIIFLTVVQIKSYYKIKYPNLWKWISVIPSFQLIIAYIFLQTYLFLKIDGHSFSLLEMYFFLGSSLTLGILTLSIQTIIKKWEFRAELQALIAMFQLLIAMFLPLIARGKRVGFTQITVDYLSIGFVTLLITLISVLGYFIYKRKNKQLT